MAAPVSAACGQGLASLIERCPDGKWIFSGEASNSHALNPSPKGQFNSEVTDLNK